MKKIIVLSALAMSLLACNKTTNNPLLEESKNPCSAPAFDLIQLDHYLPAFEAAIAAQKAEVDAIINNPEAPTFENTIEGYLSFCYMLINS